MVQRRVWIRVRAAIAGSRAICGVKRLRLPRDRKISSFGKRASTNAGFRKAVFVS
jgi:hypothetical protein